MPKKLTGEKLTEEQLRQTSELNGQGLSMNQIGEILGIHATTVRNRLKFLGITPNYERSPGGLQIIYGMGICKICDELQDINNFGYVKKTDTYNTTCNTCRNRKRIDQKNSNVVLHLAGMLGDMKKRDKYQEFTKYDLADIYEQQNGLCFYTNEKLVWRSGAGRHNRSLSVDKVLPGQGYVKGNVVLCCDWINRMKNDADLETLKVWMPLVYEKIQQGYKDGILY